MIIMFNESILEKFALPASAINSQGLRYNPNLDVWEISATNASRIDLSQYREILTSSFLLSLKLSLVALNARLQPGSVINYLFMGLNPFLDSVQKPYGEITQQDLEAYWLSLPSEQKKRFHGLKTICRELRLHGIPDHSVSHEAYAYINTLSIPNNEQGRAVATWDPVSGPLTPDELDAFIRALHAGFANGKVDAENYILILLLASIGARNAALADLKICDLKTQERDGVTNYYLNIPRVKQRSGRFRAEHYMRKLVPELGAILEEFIHLQKERNADLGLGEELPIFVYRGNSDPIRTCHRSTDQISHRVTSVSDHLAVTSSRTTDVLDVNSRRFRYTVGTIARAMGMSPSTIAALLDHGDTRTQEVYAAISPEVLEDITRRLGSYRDPLAAAFLGRIAEPGEGMEPQKLVFRARFYKDCSEPSVGSCEASRKCGGRKPYACYLCSLFVASMEGDHEGALEDVIEERVRFDQDAGEGLRFLTADSVAQAIRKVIAMVHQRLEEIDKTLEQIREEKETILRNRGVIA